MRINEEKITIIQDMSKNSYNLDGPIPSQGGNFAISIQRTGYEENGKKYYIKRKNGFGFMLNITIDGEGYYRVNENEYYPKKGDIIFTPLSEKQEIYSISDKWTIFFVHFSGDIVQNVFQEVFNSCRYLIHDADINKMSELFTRLHNEVNTIGGSSLDASSICYELLMEVVKASNKQKMNAYPFPIISALSFINNNYFKQISIDDIVLSSNLSKYYFCHLFKKYLNTTPYDYLSKLRLKYSIDYLLTSDMKLYEIAEKVGIDSEKNLIRLFRKYLDTTPKKYKMDALTKE